MNRKTDLDSIIKDYKESTLDEVFVEHVLDDLNDIKKFYKPVVLQFVADWYEENKDDLETAIFRYAYTIDKQPYSLFKEWFTDIEADAFHTLINMHQFGYEVEKEPKYKVRMKELAQYRNTLAYGNVSKTWFFASSEGTDVRVKHTRGQLEEAGFSEIFNNPLFVVEEVE